MVLSLKPGLIEYDAGEDGAAFLFPEVVCDGIQVPCEFADGVYSLTDRWLVDYLRLSFRWGGFPGWRNYPNRPESERAYLADGLLEI